MDGAAALCVCREFSADDLTPWSFPTQILLPRAAPEVLWIHQEEPVDAPAQDLPVGH